jgi:phosphatidylethanolamine/phosphatidyl-N-methylethanolamine N-methyltransferase
MGKYPNYLSYKENMRFYNRIGSLYVLIDQWLMPSKQGLINYVNEQSPKEVLDFAMGMGAWWKHIDENEVTLTGIDTSDFMVNHAKAQYPNKPIFLSKSNRLPLADASFDMVILAHVLSVVKDPTDVLNEVHRVLKPNGRLIIINHDSTNFKFIDGLMGLFSRVVRVKLPFYIRDYIDQSKWRWIEMKAFGRFSYFNWVTLSKV